MKYVVTGGAGFIGSNLVDRLIKDGHKVIVFDDLSEGKEKNINEKAVFYKVDISDPQFVSNKQVQDHMKDATAVFHFAAKSRVQPSIESPVYFNQTNVTGLLHMLQASVDANVQRFVYSSSSSVYGDVELFPTPESTSLNPMSPYALQKLVGEQYCRLFSELYHLKTVSLRYFNVYGERQSLEGGYCLVMGIFAQQRLNGKPMTVRGDGEQRRDFTYVGDVVEANVLSATSDNIKGGEIYNVGNGDNRSVNQLADLIGGERIHVDPVIEPKKTLADNSLLRQALGWKPTVVLEDWIQQYKKDLGL